VTTTFAPDQRISMLVHAASKAGKSTLTSTAPAPVLVLDAEGSWRFIPVRKTYWDPVNPPPAVDGTWDACIVSVRDWDTVMRVYNWMIQYETGFVSVVVDSVTEIQRRCKQNLKGTDAMKIQDWGVLLTLMDNVIRGFRDLTLIQWSSVRCVVFVAETKQREDKMWAPHMQGAIATSMPYWVDIIGYLYPDFDIDGNGQPTVEVRRLLIGPNAQFVTGERVQGRLPYTLTVRKPASGAVGTEIEDWMKTVFGITTTQEEGSVA
jgi:AAA domain-containing protein